MLSSTPSTLAEISSTAGEASASLAIVPCTLAAEPGAEMRRVHAERPIAATVFEAFDAAV